MGKHNIYFVLKSFLNLIMLIYLSNLPINSINENVLHYEELLGQLKTLQKCFDFT